jgi:glycosyltransferase involved in cell wall biosynthesis
MQTTTGYTLRAGFNLLELILTLRPDLCGRFGFDLPENRSQFISWLVTSGVREYQALALDPGFRALMSGYGPGEPLSRLQTSLWLARPDVRQAYPANGDWRAFLDWYYMHGVGEHGLWHFLSDEERRRVLYRKGPWQEGFKVAQSENVSLANTLAWRQRPWGVNVVGYAYGQLGIGEDARMAAIALRTADVPMTMLNFDPGADVPQNDRSMAEHVSASAPYAFNLVCLTALEHGRFYAERGGGQFAGRYNIGYWPWELSDWPAQWRQLVHLVDEVWVSTQHTRAAVEPLCLALHPPVPVRVMPMAVLLGPVEERGGRAQVRKQFGLPAEACLFCFSFDLNSSVHRKNPQGVVDAFLLAFPEKDWSSTQVGLIIKVHPPKRRNLAWEKLKAVVAQDRRLHIVELTLSRPALLGLYRACDCFVSLHRAEGFGRGIAEALQLGLHVITTGYSGNLDFCAAAEFADRVCLVRYRLVKVKPGHYPYSTGQVWANPDLRHAAQCMTRFAGNLARLRSEDRTGTPPHAVPPQGWPVFSPSEVGQRYRRRLQALCVGEPGTESI